MLTSLAAVALIVLSADGTAFANAFSASSALADKQPLGTNASVRSIISGQTLGHQAHLASPASDQRAFTPFEDLNALSATQFTRLDHPLFPSHSVRVKKSKFCDGTVDAYTGYIDISATRHLFFYFFESRNVPHTDDVIFWTNGGPGGSSSMGAFMELGPCMILDENGPKYNKEAWNTNANLFFVDQPVGVGFSYADYGEYVDTTEQAAVDIAAFIAIFFEHFTKFQGRALHMAGESFGGRYIPLFASAVYDQNAMLEAAGLAPVNLSSIMIGNGRTDELTMAASFYDIVCTQASLNPVLDISTCVRMRQAVPRCVRRLKESCYDILDLMNCQAAYDFCSLELFQPAMVAQRNPYDVSKACTPEELDKTVCYDEVQHIEAYLSQTDVQTALGVDDAVKGNFSIISLSVNAAFVLNAESALSSYDYVAELLERGVRVLIYAGTYDLSCNWVGNEHWTRALDWSGREAFSSQPLAPWYFHGEAAGVTRSASRLTFATIAGAGHMAPYDKPKESLYIVQRWLAGDRF